MRKNLKKSSFRLGSDPTHWREDELQNFSSNKKKPNPPPPPLRWWEIFPFLVLLIFGIFKLFKHLNF